MKKILITALVLAGFSATAQVKVGSNPTTLATDAKFQVEGSTGAQTVILDNGNVGIGTTTPGQKLTVAAPALGSNLNDITSGLEFASSVGLNNSSLKIFNNRFAAGGDWLTSSTRIQRTIDASIMGFVDFGGENNQSGLGFGSGSTTRMVLTDAGYLGIGTTTPSAKLEVVDNNSANGNNGVSIDKTGDTGSANILLTTNHSANSSRYFMRAYANGGGGERFSVDNNGTIYTAAHLAIGTTSITSTLQVANLPVHASNAAAITAGLTAGAFYHAGDGIVRVVF